MYQSVFSTGVPSVGSVGDNIDKSKLDGANGHVVLSKPNIEVPDDE